MAYGHLPFRGETPFDLTTQIMTGERGPSSSVIPIGLEPIIRRCLEKDPKRRYQSTRDVLEDLKTASTICPPEAPKHPSIWVRRILFPGTLAAALLFGLVFAIPSTRNLMFRRNVAVPTPVPVHPQTSLPKPPIVTSRSESTRKPDVKVWVNTESGIYHCPGSRYYGKTKVGEYMTERRAQRKGYTAASGKVCR